MKYPLECFEYWSQKIAVRICGNKKQIAAKRDIFKMLKVKYKTKAAVNLGASLLYPLANHPLALCVPGGAPRKCGKKETL